jgi:hypothetical protein
VWFVSVTLPDGTAVTSGIEYFKGVIQCKHSSKYRYSYTDYISVTHGEFSDESPIVYEELPSGAKGARGTSDGLRLYHELFADENTQSDALLKIDLYSKEQTLVVIKMKVKTAQELETYRYATLVQSEGAAFSQVMLKCTDFRNEMNMPLQSWQNAGILEIEGNVVAGQTTIV